MPNKNRQKKFPIPSSQISLRPISYSPFFVVKQIVTKSHIAVPWVHSPHPQISKKHHWRPFVQYWAPPRTTPLLRVFVVWWCPVCRRALKKAEDIEDRSLKQANVGQMVWQKLSRHVRFFRHVCARRISAFKDVNQKVYLTNHQSRNGHRNKTNIRNGTTRNSWCDHLLCWYLTHLIHSLSQPWASWKSTWSCRWEGVYMLLSGIDQIWHQIWSVRIFIGLAKC